MKRSRSFVPTLTVTPAVQAGAAPAPVATRCSICACRQSLDGFHARAAQRDPHNARALSLCGPCGRRAPDADADADARNRWSANSGARGARAASAPEGRPRGGVGHGGPWGTVPVSSSSAGGSLGPLAAVGRQPPTVNGQPVTNGQLSAVAACIVQGRMGRGLRGQSASCGELRVSNWPRNFPREIRGLLRNFKSGGQISSACQDPRPT